MTASTLLELARRLDEASTLAEVMDRVVDAVSEATRFRRASDFVSVTIKDSAGHGINPMWTSGLRT